MRSQHSGAGASPISSTEGPHALHSGTLHGGAHPESGARRLEGVLIVAALLAFGAGYFLASRSAGGARAQAVQEARDRERAESERVLARQRREMLDLETRGKEQAEIFHLLPDLVGQMFAVTGSREVPMVALKLLKQLFHPAQCGVFVTRGADDKLALAAFDGLPSTVPANFEIAYGEGRIGHVAETRIAMDDADFRNAPPAVRRHIETTAIRDLEAHVVAPLVSEGMLKGVMFVGGVKSLQGQEKRALRMVAELTGLALTQVLKLREVQHSADIDGLTGTFNKRYFQKRIGDEIHRAEREHHPLSLFIMDIDHFKNYNDAHGHQEGDEVLKKVGELLREKTRNGDDTAARYGGEEFVVLYPGVTKALAFQRAQALRRAIESFPFSFAGQQPLGAVTISGGVATFPEDALSHVELVRAADQALYEAKRAGRNRVKGADPNYLT